MSAYPVEKTIHYVTSTDTLLEAWAFVMSVVDEFDQPNIAIRPVVIIPAADFDEEHREELFEVSVSGQVSGDNP